MSPDGRVLRVQPFVMIAHDLAETSRVLEQPILFVYGDVGEGRGAADGVAAVGQAAVVEVRVEMPRDLVIHRDSAERQVRRGQALGHRHQIRDGVPVVDREPAPGSAEAGHHLVGDHEDVVTVADLADALDVAVGRDEDAVRPDDRLEENRRDRVGAFVADDILQALEAFGCRSRLLFTPAMGVRVADDTDDAGLVGPASRVAGQGHRP